MKNFSIRAFFAQFGLPLLAIFCACVLAYGPSLKAPFLWDDEVMVVSNPLIRPGASVGAIFGSSAFGESFDAGAFYRPLQILSYKMDFALWELNPMGYRATSVLIHFLSMCVLFLCLRRFGFSDQLSLFLCVIYAVHPLAIESVTYISGRGDAMMMLFSLLAFYCFLRASRNGFVGAVLFYFLAIFTKENAVILPGMMMVYLLFFKEEKPGIFSWLSFMVCFACGGLYSLYRVHGAATSHTATLSEIAEASFWERFLTVPRVLISYLQLFLFPHDLHMEYHFVETTLNSPYIYVGGPLLLIATLFLARYKKWFFFWLVFLIGLLPVLHLATPLASTIREHWLYLPGIGLLGMLGLGLQRMNKRISWVVVAVMCVGFLGMTLDRNRDWMDAKRLYAHDLALEPNSFLLHNNLGVVLFRENDEDGALKEFLLSVETSPHKRYGIAYNNAGVILEQRNRFSDAIHYYQESVRYSEYQLAYENLSRIYLRLGMQKEARDVVLKGLEKYPNSVQLQQYKPYI
jgi:uncharacterized membrane protein